jgi:hypothetical protein
MGVGGILWGRRPPKAGGGPVPGRRPARRAGRRQNLPPFRKFLIANGITTRKPSTEKYYIPPLPTPSPPFSRGERVGVRGGSYTHVPCLFGALLVSLYHFHYKLSFWAAASAQRALAAAVRARPPAGRARPSPPHIKKALASKIFSKGVLDGRRSIGGSRPATRLIKPSQFPLQIQPPSNSTKKSYFCPHAHAPHP